MTEKLFLTVATGKSGRGTAELLLKGGHRVRALVHREDDRSRALAEASAEVVVGGLPQPLRDVGGPAGCERRLLLPPDRARPGRGDRDLRAGGHRGGVGSVVNMSQVCARREAVSDAARNHWLCERLLDRTNLITTHIRPTFFAEWLTLWWQKRDGEGCLRLPFGAGRHAPIAVADQSRVIAALLRDPEPHDRASYSLHGPVEMNHYDIAQAMSATLGLPVHYEPITIEEFAEAMAKRGASTYFIQHLTNVAIDYHNGVFAGTDDNVQRISGQAPLSVEQFVVENKTAFETGGPFAF
ncbi:hypothetical protein [Actinocrispum sp. NPDC049592]|uniref:hypothetical protein n=1 Tax=Actinocrispum sp. NPDC049592 TaxID=3154835 RepID=UPI00341CFA14